MDISESPVLLSVCLSLCLDIFPTAQPLVTKLGMVVHHNELDSDAKGLVCYLQGQGHSEAHILKM